MGSRSPATVLRDARVFDGTAVHPRASLVIADGIIREIDERVDTPTHAEVIDATGRTVLPGLIDAHTHVFADSLHQAVMFGVTTELDMFADPALAATLKRTAAVQDDLADLRTAGTGATAPGGHPTGLVQRGIYPPFPTITGPTEAEQFVADLMAQGSDYLKIIIDDGDALGYPRPTLSPDTVAALITHAHARDILAVVHALDSTAARHALDAGADGLAHLPVGIDPDHDGFVALAAQQKPFVIPTLVVLEAICGRGHGRQTLSDPAIAPYLNQNSQTMLGMLGGNFPLGPDAHVDYDAAASTLQTLHQAGVPILAGTDAGSLGVAHGASIHRELQLLVHAGLTPTNALTAATAAPAAHFGLTDRGHIHPSAAADLLLVNGDPTTDITATLNIHTIWRRGTRINRNAP